MRKTATIHIRDMSLKAVIGTDEKERLSPQDLVINISFGYDASLAVGSDALGHAVDYRALEGRIKDYVEGSRFLLLERLAGEVLDIVMADQRIVFGKVTVDKPKALLSALSVAVEVSINREDNARLPPVTTRCY
jgi:FolB domain-containing protein